MSWWECSRVRKPIILGPRQGTGIVIWRLYKYNNYQDKSDKGSGGARLWNLIFLSIIYQNRGVLKVLDEFWLCPSTNNKKTFRLFNLSASGAGSSLDFSGFIRFSLDSSRINPVWIQSRLDFLIFFWINPGLDKSRKFRSGSRSRFLKNPDQQIFQN